MNSFDFFNTLQSKSKQQLLDLSRFTKISQGTQLFEQGDICVRILFLTKGRVRVVRQNDNGQSVLLYYFSKGEQCNVNFISSNNSAPAIGTAIAETPLEGFSIPAKLVSKLFIEDKAFQQYLFTQYSNRLESMASAVVEIRFSSLDTRLLQWLQSLDEKEIHISHEEIGKIIGTSREVVSRILKSFEKNKIVKLFRKKIELL
jgi:CRP/FNR family transcriptional regulator